ncbi:MAG: DUF1430 domain-containing protein [Oscillospiraceae bacterium]|nr:DUF1430 domain-containing protein [Oscillospiraceae bacterium]
MKLITTILSVFAMFCISIYSVSSNISDDAERWETFGEKIGEHKSICIDLSDQSNGRIYEILTNVARKNNINLIKKNTLCGDNSKIASFVFLGNSDIKLVDDKEFISGNFFSKENTEENLYISTLEDDKAFGRIYSFLNWNRAEIGTLKRLLENDGSMRGEYVVRYTSYDDYDNFLENLAEEFKVDKEKLMPTFSYSKGKGNSITIFSQIFVAASVILATITAMFYSVKSLKSVGIMKLCGYSLQDILKKVFGNIFVVNFVFSIIFDASLVVVFKTVPLDFLIWLLYQQCFVSFLILLGIVPSVFLIEKYRISDLIYDRNPAKIINGLNFCVKCALLCALIVTSYHLPTTVSKIPELNNTIKRWEKISNFATIDCEGNYANAIQDFNENKVNRILEYKKILDHFGEKGSFYCHFYEAEISSDLLEKMKQERLNFDDKLLNPGFSFKTLDVNPNYFKRFDIKGLDGKVLNFSDNENQRIILRPASSSFSEDLVKKVYNFNLEREIEKEGNYKHSKEVKVITYDDSTDEFCTFSKNESSKHDLFEKSLFFEVVPVKLMGEFELYYVLFDQALKVPLGNEDLADFNEKSKKEFEEIGIDRNSYKFSNVKSVSEFELDRTKKMLVVNLCTLALFLILVILISFSLTKFYIETYKKVIGVKKIHGFSVVSCHKNYFLLLFASSIFATSLVCYQEVRKTPGNADLVFSVPGSIIFTGLFVALFDFLISYAIVRFYEKRKLSNILKGS